MKRIESPEDFMRGIVRYELEGGRMICLNAHDVREYGAKALLEAEGLISPDEGKRLPVIWHGQQVGTMPAGFDPFFAKSKSFLYDPRPGDFRRDGDTWVASRTLGPGDLEAVPGFERQRG
jgi:hypothetical protein